MTSVVTRTMCPMNCHPTLCGMLVETRDNKVISVKGDPDNPDSKGFLCIRGQASKEIFDNPARLRHPMMRDNRSGEFRQVSWDDAMQKILHSIRQSPAAATAMWPGHGTASIDYGTRISAQYLGRFANLYGSQFWNPAMVCWGLGGFGLALTGMLETHTKEDMGEHSQMILMWAANLTSQPNTARHLVAARKRGAHVVTIDVRHTEAAAKSDDVFLIRPGSDGALALAMCHVICGEGLYDASFVEQNSVGFAELKEHVRAFTPEWAEGETGIEAARIVGLARRYAATKPAMIVLGGSSMNKGANGWQATRAIACLPGLTGNVGIGGAGFGPRHGSAAHGRGLGNITAAAQRATGTAMSNQMSGITEALQQGQIHNLLLFGSNMLSSFADSGALVQGLQSTRLIVSYDLFLNDTARQFADIVLPATAWLEDLGCKATATHLYLMPRVLEAEGEARSLHDVVKALACGLGMKDFYPWASEEEMINAVLDHPCTGPATVASLRAQGGMAALNISHVANPALKFDTPSGKIEFLSQRAARLGLGGLPGQALSGGLSAAASDGRGAFPLTLTQGRTMTHFHSFYNNGRELPTLARRELEPHLWISTLDAQARGISEGDAIRMFNEKATFGARAHVTEKIPSGTLWIRDGWAGLNGLTSGNAVLPDEAVDLFPFSAGQATYEAWVEVSKG